MKMIAHVFLHNFTGSRDELAFKCYDLSPRVETPAENEAFIDLSGKNPPRTGVISSFAGELVPSLGSFAIISLAPCRLLAKALTLVLTRANVSAGISPDSCKKTPPLPGTFTKANNKCRLSVIKSETVGNFTSQLPLDFMWPLEHRVIKRLKTLGLKSFSEVSAAPLTMLYSLFGSLAPLIIDYSQGIDTANVPLFNPPDRVTYHTRCICADKTRIETILKEAAIHIGLALQERGKSYRELALTIFSGEGLSKNVSSSFTRGKYDIPVIHYDCINLLKRIQIESQVTELSLSAGNLINNTHSQMSLFEDPKTLSSHNPGHKEKLARVCENLASKYAPGVIKMGAAIPVSRREQMLMFVDPIRSK